MPNLRLHKSTTVDSEWQAQAVPIRNFIIANPATNPASIAAGLTLDQSLVDRVLASLERTGTIIRGFDTAGLIELHEAGAFGAVIFSRLSDARTWLATNDGGTADQMAAALVVSESVAIKLSQMLAAESDVKLTSF